MKKVDGLVWDCECSSMMVSLAKHRTWHSDFADGPKVTLPAIRSGISSDGYSRVRCIDAAPAVHFCWRLACVFRRAGRYDFVSWTSDPRHIDDEWSKYQATTIMYCREGRAQSWAVVRKRDWGFHVIEGIEGSIPGEKHDCFSIDTIFTAKNARRQGQARQLVEHIAIIYGVEIEELGWGSPLSDDGEALVSSLGLHDYWGA